MELWLESCIVVLAVLVLLLCIRLHLAKKVALEIHAALPEKLNTDTNTPITLSCRDKDLCLLADTLNQSLEQLRAMQHCFKQGNTQLQTSITSISHDLRLPGTFGKGTVICCLPPVCCHHPGMHKGDDTTDGRTVPVFSCPVCAFGTAPAGSVGKPHFRGKHCRNVCGAQKTPDHAGHYHNRPYRAAHARSVRLIARLFQPVKQCRKIQ